MVERLVLIDKQRMSYEGLFSQKGFYDLVDKLIRENGYVKREIRNAEFVKSDGRQIEILIEPWKRLSDYARSVIKIKMVFENIKDIIIEKEGIKKNMNQGRVNFVFDAYLETDFEHRWENTPGFFFVRVLFDKYFFKPFTTNYQKMVMHDFSYFINEIRAFLNLNKY